MSVHFLDNYPKTDLGKSIKKKDGSPLQGEIWVYNQFLEINEHELLSKDTWYLKHDYDLSLHPEARGKVEGQIDFLLLTKDGLIIIEVKGGGLRVDENDCYFSYNRNSEYETQNPFKQAKEYVHSLKNLIANSNLFICRAIILPHESGFVMRGAQLIGYQHSFFSKQSYIHCDSPKAINNCFFDFISSLCNISKRHVVKNLMSTLRPEQVNRKAMSLYPSLSKAEQERIKGELFPTQTSYGYNPERINSELILNENYDIFLGLRKNKKTMIQGAPGTGKTILAQKFVADKMLKQQKGIVFCANKLIKSKLQHILLNEHQLDPENLDFRIFSGSTTAESVKSDLDFLVFDEAQEYFDKGLIDFLEVLNHKLYNPQVMILFDPEQTIVKDHKELAWYADYLISEGYTHYFFDKNHRCIQNPNISNIADLISLNRYKKIINNYPQFIIQAKGLSEKLDILDFIKNDSRFVPKEKIVLVQHNLIDEVKKYAIDFEELTETNINQLSQNIRYTTPIKYRGLENKSVYLITDDLSDKNQVELYIGSTRSMESLKIILWK